MKDSKTLQSQISQVEEIFKYFEDSNKEFNLDEGLKKYDEAMAIVKEVKEKLNSYELKIKEIQTKYEDSEPTSDDE